MKKFLQSFLGLGFLWALAADATPSFKEMRTADLVRMMNDKSTVVKVYDANNAKTREANGTIPGATLLDSYDKYPTTLLPEDKKTTLVFFCANTKCTASDGAAKRAAKAGYKNVAVLRDGIQGWKEAGQSTTPVKN